MKLLVPLLLLTTSLAAQELQVSKLTAIRCPVDDAASYSWLVFGPGGKPVDFVTNGNERSIFLPESEQWRIVICTADGKQYHKRIEGTKPSDDSVNDPVDIVKPKPKPAVSPAFVIVLRRTLTDEQKQVIAQLKDKYKDETTKVADLHADNKDPRVAAWMKWVNEDDLPYWFAVAADGSILSQGKLSETGKLE